MAKTVFTATSEAQVGFSEVTTTFHLEGELTDEQKKQIVDYVETHCPVQDTLSNPASYSVETA